MSSVIFSYFSYYSLHLDFRLTITIANIKIIYLNVKRIKLYNKKIKIFWELNSH